MTFKIKKLSPVDIKSAKGLFVFFQIDDGFDNPTSESDEYLKNLLLRDDFYVVVAVENEKVIGGLTAYELTKYKCETTEMLLYEIAVESSHRRKGIAAELVKYLKNICAEKSISAIFVATETDNTPANNLYETTGRAAEETVFYTY